MQRGSMTSHEWATVKIESLKIDTKIILHAMQNLHENKSAISSPVNDESLEVQKQVKP